MIWYSWFDFIYLKECTLDSINYLGWESNISISPLRFFEISQWVRLSWKIAYAMILANNTKWVSCQLFVCGRVKLGSLGKRHPHHLSITEFLLIRPVGHMDPHITDWVTRHTQEPWAGNMPIFQVVYISIFCLPTLLRLSRV